MEPSSQPQPAIGDVAGESQVYHASAYPSAETVAVAPGVAPAGSQPAPPFHVNPAQLNAQNQLINERAQQFHQQLQQQQQRQLQQFWAERLSETEQEDTDFKNHTLPLARIKKIMRADEDVRMISAEAPVVFAKACEIFILELSLRSWMHTDENKRRTLQKNDLAAAITRTDVYDFLLDIFPRDETREEGGGLPRALGAPADAYPYYYPPDLQHLPGAAMGYGVQQVPQGHPTYAWHDPQGQQQQGHQAEQQQPASG